MPEVQRAPERAPLPEAPRNPLHEREAPREVSPQESGAPQKEPGQQPVSYAGTATEVTPLSSTAVQDPVIKEIETILADGMEDFFLHLDKRAQWEFKVKGEETARSIQGLLRKGSYAVKDVVSLILGWLRSLPGVNKFFIEQEAKIKADRIIERFK